MSSSEVKEVALVGAGFIGKPIGKALLDAGLQLKVVSRSDQAKPGLEKAATVAVDYDSQESLQKAFQGVDVVVNTTSHPLGLADQTRIADAAKSAGVKLFVTSDFGVDPRRIPQHELPPLVSQKQELAKHLESIKLPYLRIYTGVFGEYLYSPFVGFDAAKSELNFVGPGDVPVASTAVVDVGGFVAHVLTTQQISQLSNKEVTVESFKHTLQEYAEAWTQVKGTQWKLNETSREDALASIPTLQDPLAQFSTWVKAGFAAGYGDNPSDNDKFGFKPKLNTPAALAKTL